MLGLAFFIVFAASAEAATLRGEPAAPAAGATPFTEYYATIKEGRGIWKWNNALVAYDQNFAKFQGKPAIGAEVGVQSGGSIQMWKKVLGDKANVHGLDINPNCANFTDSTTSITIGDQENPQMWSSFFAKVTKNLDFLVDDGGHFPNQMLETTYAVWPKLNPGGIIAIEDIHGAHYLDSFFKPVAQFIGTQSDVGAVHIYAYLMLAEKKGGDVAPYDPSQAKGAVVTRVQTLEAMRAALQSAPKGSVVVLENKAWGNFIQPTGLSNFFAEVIGLYQPVAMPDDPVGCAEGDAPKCVFGTTNSPEQASVYSAHVLPDKFVVQVPKETVVIQAVRRGTEWVHRPETSEIPARLQAVIAGSGTEHAIHHISK